MRNIMFESDVASYMRHFKVDRNTAIAEVKKSLDKLNTPQEENKRSTDRLSKMLRYSV